MDEAGHNLGIVLPFAIFIVDFQNLGARLSNVMAIWVIYI
jgi:hypothetical protein